MTKVVSAFTPGSSRKRNLEYPFKKSWVCAATLMAIISIIFAVLVLAGEEPLVVSFYFFYPFTFVTHPLLLYSLFVSCLIIIVFIVKLYLYSIDEEEPEDSFTTGKEVAKRRWRWSLIILFGSAIAALFIPLVLLAFLDPLWWFISISGFVPGITIPEIMLFLYCRQGIKGMKK